MPQTVVPKSFHDRTPWKDQKSFHDRSSQSRSITMSPWPLHVVLCRRMSAGIFGISFSVKADPQHSIVHRWIPSGANVAAIWLWVNHLAVLLIGDTRWDRVACTPSATLNVEWIFQNPGSTLDSKVALGVYSARSDLLCPSSRPAKGLTLNHLPAASPQLGSHRWNVLWICCEGKSLFRRGWPKSIRDLHRNSQPYFHWLAF